MANASIQAAFERMWSHVTTALNGKVSTSRTINGKALNSNISLTASDVGADASGAAATALSDAKAYTISYTDASVRGLASQSYVNGKIATKASMETLTVTLSASSWSNNSITVTATGVTADNTVIVSSAPASQEAYGAAGVTCTAQAANSLTFTCTQVPTTDLSVNLVILS